MPGAADEGFVGADGFFQDTNEGVDADHQSGNFAVVATEGEYQASRKSVSSSAPIAL